MPQFEIRITQRAFAKGDQGQIRKEFYDDWKIADTVYCLYRDLVNIDGSGILGVDFIEHRQERKHKSIHRDGGTVVDYVNMEAA